MREPTAPAVLVCREHWNPPRRRCVACPIAATCSERVPLTQEAIDDHWRRLNVEAERLLEAMSVGTPRVEQR